MSLREMSARDRAGDRSFPVRPSLEIKLDLRREKFVDTKTGPSSQRLINRVGIKFVREIYLLRTNRSESGKKIHSFRVRGE